MTALGRGIGLEPLCVNANPIQGTMPMADMLKKLRAYHHFIKREQKHKEAFGVHPIRSVLIEAPTETRPDALWNL